VLRFHGKEDWWCGLGRGKKKQASLLERGGEKEKATFPFWGKKEKECSHANKRRGKRFHRITTEKKKRRTKELLDLERKEKRD